jgi:hypothetical protein
VEGLAFEQAFAAIFDFRSKLMRIVTILIVMTALLALGVGSPARAAVIFSFSGGNLQSAGNTITYGFQFTPVVNVTVDSLGYYDAGQNGLAAEGHQVGIWDISGDLLASTTVTTANSTLLGPVVNGGQCRFTSITGLNLLAGDTYVFGADSGSFNDFDTWYYGGTNISESPSLVRVSPVGYYYSFDFKSPNLTIDNTYAAGSFTAFATVPEPSTITLLGVGALGLLGYALQRRCGARACFI